MKLDVGVAGRLPEPVEVAAYYVVSEALANAAKHSGAAVAEVGVAVSDGVLHICVLDDGAGGADSVKGSGIVGLRDRVEALGGTMAVTSPPGEGTSIAVELPLAPSDTRPLLAGHRTAAEGHHPQLRAVTCWSRCRAPRRPRSPPARHEGSARHLLPR